VYICLGQLKRGCLEGCRPVLSLDGCFIKGPRKGQILVAVGRDGNNQMYPIAWAVCERENSVNWVGLCPWLHQILECKMGVGDVSFLTNKKALLMLSRPFYLLLSTGCVLGMCMPI